MSKEQPEIALSSEWIEYATNRNVATHLGWKCMKYAFAAAATATAVTSGLEHLPWLGTLTGATLFSAYNASVTRTNTTHYENLERLETDNVARMENGEPRWDLTRPFPLPVREFVNEFLPPFVNIKSTPTKFSTHETFNSRHP